MPMPDEADAGPPRLEIVRSFVNTRDIEAGQDRLSSPRALDEWLSGSGLDLEPTESNHGDLALATDAREALRSLLWTNNGEPPDDAAAAVLNDVVQRADVRLQFGPGGAMSLRPTATGVVGALGQLLGIVAGSMTDGTWPRLKACRNHTCGWAFYDHARNRSARWCSMAVCGNRMKVRTFRARQRGGGA